MELLLQGEETEIIPLKICTPILRITMDATLKITKGTDGKPIVEINGLSPDMDCLLYTSPSPRDGLLSRMPSSA